MLTLAEELLLLALRDEEGTVAGGKHLVLKFGLSGAVLSELALRGRLRLDDEQRVELVDGSPMGDDLFDEALGAIARRNRPRALKDWVLSLGRRELKNARDRLLGRLVAAGIVREEEGRILWLFPTHRYPELNPMPEDDVRERIRAVVLHGSTPDERTLVLLSLIAACRLVNEVFPGEERGAARQRIEELTQGEAAGVAVAKAVRVMESAVMAAVAASAASAATSASS